MRDSGGRGVPGELAKSDSGIGLPDGTRRTCVEHPDEPAAREVEVLRMIAEGQSNPEVAHTACLHRDREDPHQQSPRQSGATGPRPGHPLRVPPRPRTAARAAHHLMG